MRLYVIRCLRIEGYQQPDVDYVFRSIVLLKLTYGLPAYASSIPELTTVQKRNYISYQIDIYLTIIPRGRVGYEMIHSQRGA